MSLPDKAQIEACISEMSTSPRSSKNLELPNFQVSEHSDWPYHNSEYDQHCRCLYACMTQPQAPEIIDLTSMPSPEIFDPDSDEKGDPETTTHFVLTSGSGHEKQKKESSRRKKWKRSLVDGEGQGSSANTRDNENGRMDARSPQKRRDGSHNGSRTTRADEPKEQWRHRTRDQHSQGQSLPARPRSHSPRRRRKRSASPQSPRDTSDLYYIDIKPAQLPSAAQFVTTHGSEQAEGTTKLLLPAHVSVFGTVPVEILPPSVPDSDEEDYIDYIDYDDRKVGFLFQSFSLVYLKLRLCKGFGTIL